MAQEKRCIQHLEGRRGQPARASGTTCRATPGTTSHIASRPPRARAPDQRHVCRSWAAVSHQIDSESTPRATVSHPVDSESTPRATVSHPVDSESTPWATVSHPVDSESTPWATVSHPVDSESTPGHGLTTHAFRSLRSQLGGEASAPLALGLRIGPAEEDDKSDQRNVPPRAIR